MAATMDSLKDSIVKAIAEIDDEIGPMEEQIRDKREERDRLQAMLSVAEGAVAPVVAPRARTRTASSNGRTRVDDVSIVDAARSIPQDSVTSGDISKVLGGTLEGQALSLRLKALVTSGQLVKTGERRGTRYSLPS